ncbi:MAG: TldD/PmbA family protein, partial [Bacilli bacterium]|nr:TldD/PmbA family protein [Bacilli bacterium]
MNYKEFFKKAQEKGITNIQITEKENHGSNVKMLNGELDYLNSFDSIGYNIKAEYNEKTVKLDCNYLAEDILDLLIMKSTATDSSYADEYLEKDKNIEKEKSIDRDVSEETKKLKELDKLKTNYKNLDALETYFTESYQNTRIINSKGVDISTNSHLSTFAVEVLVKDKEITSYGKDILTTNKKDINFEEFTKDVIEKAVIQNNKEKLECRKYNIILDNDVAARIISHLGIMVAGDSIRNKVSCLENKLGKQVFSKKLTIVEEPTNKKYPGYRLFDDEGTKTIDKIIIDAGKVNNYLYNVKEAKIKDIKSTGNGYGGIATRNMYVKPGDKSVEELLKDLDNGIYITDFMGSMRSAINTVNGQISLQVFGFIVENGKIIKGFVPAIMTTTI